MIIKNVKIYRPDKTFVSGNVVIKGDRIAEILPEESKEAAGGRDSGRKWLLLSPGHD